MKSSLVCVIIESLGTSQIGFEYRSQDMILFFIFLLTLSHVQCFSVTRIIVFLCHIILECISCILVCLVGERRSLDFCEFFLGYKNKRTRSSSCERNSTD